MKNFMGKCQWCGREIGVMAEDQLEADRIVEATCYCEGAEIALKKEEMRIEVDRLIGEGCGETSDFKPVNNEAYGVIMNAAMATVEGTLQGASFKVDGTNIKITNSGKTKIKRDYKYERSGKVG